MTQEQALSSRYARYQPVFSTTYGLAVSMLYPELRSNT